MTFCQFSSHSRDFRCPNVPATVAAMRDFMTPTDNTPYLQ
jgi:hypothetical protein